VSIFTDEYFEGLNSDPKIAIHQISTLFNSKRDGNNTSNLNFHLEYFAIAESFINGYELEIDLPSLLSIDTQTKIKKITSFAVSIITNLNDYVRENKEAGELTNFRKIFSTKFGNPFVYEFSDGDISRIQLLLNELRESISSSSDFDEKHKRRLLKRLESLQSELHKKMSDLDHFWGLVGDAGVVLGKFGKNAKPFVDRIKEITNIVWNTQSRAEELPSGTSSPALPNSDSER
jgi:hypothetical protein